MSLYIEYSCEIAKLYISTHYSKIINKVKVFKMKAKLQGQEILVLSEKSCHNGYSS